MDHLMPRSPKPPVWRQPPTWTPTPPPMAWSPPPLVVPTAPRGMSFNTRRSLGRALALGVLLGLVALGLVVAGVLAVVAAPLTGMSALIVVLSLGGGAGFRLVWDCRRLR